jgi:hypothetical protein
VSKRPPIGREENQRAGSEFRKLPVGAFSPTNNCILPCWIQQRRENYFALEIVGSVGFEPTTRGTNALPWSPAGPPEAIPRFHGFISSLNPSSERTYTNPAITSAHNHDVDVAPMSVVVPFMVPCDDLHESASGASFTQPERWSPRPVQ